MTARHAERTGHALAALGVWIPFLTARALKDVQSCSYKPLGSDLPSLTLLWLQFADSWLTLAVPAAFTALLLWLLWRRSVHGSWVAVGALLVGIVYGALAQTAAVLPTMKLCASL